MSREEVLQGVINRAFAIASDEDYGWDAQNAIYDVLKSYATVDRTSDLREKHRGLRSGTIVRATDDIHLYRLNGYRKFDAGSELVVVKVDEYDRDLIYVRGVDEVDDFEGYVAEIFEFERVEEEE